MPPAPLAAEGEDARQRGLGDDGEVDSLAGVIGRAVELVEQRDARRARPLGEGQLRRLLSRTGPGRSSSGSRGKMKL
jgi:hypothetical protein